MKRYEVRLTARASYQVIEEGAVVYVVTIRHTRQKWWAADEP